jgi:hypothetical protein
MKEFEQLKELILKAKNYQEVEKEINLLPRDKLVEFLHYHDRHGHHTDEMRTYNQVNPYTKPVAAFIAYAIIKKQSHA